MSPDKFLRKVAKFGGHSLNSFDVIQLFSKGPLNLDTTRSIYKQLGNDSDLQLCSEHE